MLPLRRRGAGAGRPSNVAAGRSAERRARRYYRLRGYTILGANVRAGGNELDLVVRRGSQLVFCEVKMRSRSDFGDAIEVVGPEKQRRLRHAADCWLAIHPELEELEMSFDIVGIDAGGIERVRDAF